VERLRELIKDWTWTQEFGGAPYTCRFCGVMERKGEHHNHCMVKQAEGREM
jgi:hypothetical protein